MVMLVIEVDVYGRLGGRFVWQIFCSFFSIFLSFRFVVHCIALHCSAVQCVAAACASGRSMRFFGCPAARPPPCLCRHSLPLCPFSLRGLSPLAAAVSDSRPHSVSHPTGPTDQPQSIRHFASVEFCALRQSCGDRCLHAPREWPRRRPSGSTRRRSPLPVWRPWPRWLRRVRRRQPKGATEQRRRDRCLCEQ